ncbi:MAG: IPExxxVDY family protein [Bacteroidetes bacterium]|nr:IPExxxVDY family protein [Bacteroidota bacterium]
MAKHTLNTSSDDLDFVLIGITSAENQYSLVTSINRAIGIDLALGDNIPYNLKGGKLFYFSLFRYVSEEMGLEYFLIPNASNLEINRDDGAGAGDLFSEHTVEESTRLVKELPKTDYFIILKGEDLHLFQFKIIENLKTIQEIIQVQNIEPNDLPSKMNLVF